MTSLSDRLDALMTDRKLGARELGRAADVAHSLISEVRTGKRADIMLPVAQKLAKGLGITVAELIGEAAPAGSAGDAALIPHDRIRPSPFNPRKRFSAAAADELVTSIEALGLLQPVVVRLAADGMYELAAGERRWKAIGVLIERGSWPAEKPVPARVADLADEDMLEIGLAENMARDDLHPLEKAEAFAELARRARYGDSTTQRIADMYGKTRRWVQVYVKLADTLTPKVKAAWLDGRIDQNAAEAFALGTRKRQDTVLKAMGDGAHHSWVKGQMLGDLPRVRDALFRLDAYTGEILGEEDDKDRRFADADQAAELQTAAIKAREEQLRGTWAWVETIRALHWTDQYRYVESKNKKLAGAVILVKPDGSVSIYEGYLKPADARKAAKEREKKSAARERKAKEPELDGAAAAEPEAEEPPEPVSFQRAHLEAAKRRKTEALQTAMAANPRIAKIAVCWALLGCEAAVRIKPAERKPVDRALSPVLAEILERSAKVLDLHFDATRSHPLSASAYHPEVERQAEVWILLGQLDDRDLDTLFAALVAANVGSFNDWKGELGDDLPAVALAESLGVEAASVTIDDDWLKHYQKPALMEMARATKAIGNSNLKQLRAMRNDVLRDGVRKAYAEGATHIPRELRFGTRAELEKLAIDVTGAA